MLLSIIILEKSRNKKNREHSLGNVTEDYISGFICNGFEHNIILDTLLISHFRVV